MVPLAQRGPQVRRQVVVEVAAEAARSVPGVTRLGRGPTLFPGAPVEATLDQGTVVVRLSLVAAEGVRLVSLGADVRRVVAAAIERLLGLSVEEVTVVIDGIGT